jgi:hypothetical protein
MNNEERNIIAKEAWDFNTPKFRLIQIMAMGDPSLQQTAERNLKRIEAGININYSDIVKLLNPIGSITQNYAADYVAVQPTAKALKLLVVKYPFLFDMKDKQNDAPAFGEFLNIIKNDDILEAYVCTELREDMRVTIEGIKTKHIGVVAKLLKFKPDDIYVETKDRSRNILLRLGVLSTLRNIKPPKTYRLWWD